MNSTLRIGQGFDIHALVKNRPLILGGIEIPYTHGLFGHSDADVLLHAIIDSLLGAAGLGDIGLHFPNTEPIYQNQSSLNMLSKIITKINEIGWSIVNLDTTIHAQEPIIAPYISGMIERISENLKIHKSQINIKVKTNEGFGYLGRKEAISATAITLINKTSYLNKIDS